MHVGQRTIILLLLILNLTDFYGQEAISASCGNVKGTNGSISYSVGQLVCSSPAGTNGSLSEGVQQPYEVSMVGIGDDIYLDFECVVYPNPTSNMLVINISSFEKEGLLYRLYDSNGKLIEGKRIMGKESIIMMKNRLPAPYFLKVFDNNRLLRTFKIIKNH